MSRKRVSAVGLCALLCSATGCARDLGGGLRKSWPGLAADLGPIYLDEPASEVRREGSAWMMTENEAGATNLAIRKLIAQELTSLSQGNETAVPSRFRVTFQESRNQLWMIFPCGVLLTMFGCPMFSSSASVEVELETAGRVRKGKAEASTISIIYYQDAGYALGEALGNALRDAR
jgi:hypothetical protein